MYLYLIFVTRWPQGLPGSGLLHQHLVPRELTV